VVLWLAAPARFCGAAQPANAYPPVTLSASDRILVLAPHPDDEVLGCAGIIQQAQRLHLPVRIIFLTYGDNNEWSFLLFRKHPVLVPQAVRNMGTIRRTEAVAAARELGLLPQQLTFLGYPDFRTLDIWYAHWGKRPPERSMLTRVSAVPYADAYRPGAPYKGEEILKGLTAVIRDFNPTKIFLSHPGDHNPDHRALYLFTRVALWDMGVQGQVELYPYMIHYKNWPLPRGYLPEKSITPAAPFAQTVSWRAYGLNDAETALKLVALRKHASQFKSSGKYLLSFVRKNELFGDLPTINFTGPGSRSLQTTENIADAIEVPQELINEEKAAFVGIVKRSIILLDDSLTISLKLSRPMGKTVGTVLYIFGYRDDVAFAQMPKVRIRFGSWRHVVRDQNISIPLDAITVQRRARELTIRVPLKLLGNPQRILTSANTYMGAVPLDVISWRIVELSEAPAPQR